MSVSRPRDAAPRGGHEVGSACPASGTSPPERMRRRASWWVTVTDMTHDDTTKKGASKDLVTSFDADGVLVREAEWGGMNVGFQTFPKGFDIKPLLKGLPHDACQCPHWGLVTKGRMIVHQRGKEVAVAAGETYYLPPDHSVRFDADTELIEWSPADQLAKTMKVIEANLAR